MSQSLVVLIISVVAGLTLVMAVRELRRSESFDLSTALVLGPLVVGGPALGTGLLPPGVAVQGALAALVVGGVCNERLRGARLREGAPIIVSALPVAIALWCFFLNAFANPSQPSTEVLGRLGPVIVWGCVAAFLLMREVAPIKDFTLLVTASLSLFSLGVFVVDPWRDCDQFKCGEFGALLTGPFESENYYARLAAVALIMLLAVRPPRVWIPGALLSGLIIVATSSRTTWAALAAGLLVLMVVRVVLGANGKRAGSTWILTRILQLGAVAIFITSLLVVQNADVGSFSNRGRIWILGRDALAGHFATGLGVSRWAYLSEIGVVPPHFPHNTYLFLAFAGGLFAVGLLALFALGALGVSRGRADFGLVAGYVFFFLVLSLMETIWNPLAIDGESLIIVGLLVIVSGRSEQHLETDVDGDAAAAKLDDTFMRSVPPAQQLS